MPKSSDDSTAAKTVDQSRADARQSLIVMGAPEDQVDNLLALVTRLIPFEGLDREAERHHLMVAVETSEILNGLDSIDSELTADDLAPVKSQCVDIIRQRLSLLDFATAKAAHVAKSERDRQIKDAVEINASKAVAQTPKGGSHAGS